MHTMAQAFSVFLLLFRLHPDLLQMPLFATVTTSLSDQLEIIISLLLARAMPDDGVPLPRALASMNCDLEFNGTQAASSGWTVSAVLQQMGNRLVNWPTCAFQLAAGAVMQAAPQQAFVNSVLLSLMNSVEFARHVLRSGLATKKLDVPEKLQALLRRWRRHPAELVGSRTRQGKSLRRRASSQSPAEARRWLVSRCLCE